MTISASESHPQPVHSALGLCSITGPKSACLVYYNVTSAFRLLWHFPFSWLDVDGVLDLSQQSGENGKWTIGQGESGVIVCECDFFAVCVREWQTLLSLSLFQDQLKGRPLLRRRVWLTVNESSMEIERWRNPGLCSRSLLCLELCWKMNLFPILAVANLLNLHYYFIAQEKILWNKVKPSPLCWNRTSWMKSR